MRIRLTNTAGEVMHVSPGSSDLQIFLSVKLAPYGVRAELLEDDPPGKYGIASGKRIVAAEPETPPRTDFGAYLFRLGCDLNAIAAKKERG